MCEETNRQTDIQTDSGLIFSAYLKVLDISAIGTKCHKFNKAIFRVFSNISMSANETSKLNQ